MRIGGDAMPGDGENQEQEKMEAEPWESWETKLVTYSIGIGVLVLIVGGLLINHYLL